jgi:hypothetical protein
MADQIKSFSSLNTLKIFVSGNQSTEIGNDALSSLKELKKVKVDVYL